MEQGTGRWIILVGVWLIYAAFGTTSASLAPVLPEVRAELGLSNTALGAILGAWPLVYIFVAIPAGGFLDWAGPRISLFLAALFIALSAALRGYAQSPEMMLLAVGIFGIGGPLISVGAPKIIAGLFDGKSRGLAIGIYFTGPALGAVASLTLTNDWLIPTVGDWRGVMQLHAGFALLAGCLWIALSAGSHLSHTSSAREPFRMSSVRSLITQKEIQILLIMALSVFFINHALNNWLAAILRDKGMEPATAGYWAAIPMMIGLVAGLVIPRLATPDRRLPILITLYCAAMFTSVAIALGQGSLLLFALMLQGVVRGAINSIVILVMTELPSIPKTRVGLASGLYFSAGEIGGVLGPFTTGVLRDVTGGFVVPLMGLALVAGVLILLTMALFREQKRPT